MTTDSFTLPTGRSLRSLSPSARWTGRSASPVHSLGRQAIIIITASPLERRSPALRVRREGDTCLSPGVTQGRGSGRQRRISGAGLVAAARATGRERVTERQGYGKQRRAAWNSLRGAGEVQPTARRKRRSLMASVDPGQEEICRGSVRVERSGGAPDDQEERTETKRREHSAPSPGTNQLPGRRPRGGGQSPSFSVTKRRMNGELSFPGNQGFTFTLLLLIITLPPLGKESKILTEI